MEHRLQRAIVPPLIAAAFFLYARWINSGQRFMPFLADYTAVPESAAKGGSGWTLLVATALIVAAGFVVSSITAAISRLTLWYESPSPCDFDEKIDSFQSIEGIKTLLKVSKPQEPRPCFTLTRWSENEAALSLYRVVILPDRAWQWIERRASMAWICTNTLCALFLEFVWEIVFHSTSPQYVQCTVHTYVWTALLLLLTVCCVVNARAAQVEIRGMTEFCIRAASLSLQPALVSDANNVSQSTTNVAANTTAIESASEVDVPPSAPSTGRH